MYSSEKLTALMASVVEIANTASETLLGFYQNREQLIVEKKADDSPVSLADREVSQQIVEALRALTPDIPVMSEEGVDVDFSIRSTWATYWLVDPLDGTRGFIEGTDEFSVNIALIQQHRPVLGVVAEPVAALVYCAYHGGGAFLHNGGQVSAISGIAPDESIVESGRILMLESQRSSDYHDRIFQALSKSGAPVERRRVGSALKYCYLAAGRADIALCYLPTHEWDTAAAQVIVEEAGGAVLDTELRPLEYNRSSSLINSYLLAVANREYPWYKFL